MITTQGLIEAAKLNSGITSWYGLAKAMNIKDQTLMNYRKGRTPDDENAAKLAELAGLDIGYVLASLAAERSKDEGIKSVWARAAKRLETALPAVFLLILSMLGSLTFTPDAHAFARVAELAPTHISHLTSYTLSIRKRLNAIAEKWREFTAFFMDLQGV